MNGLVTGIALVTGGGSGIGRASARELAKTMTVLIADYSLDKAEDAAAEIRSAGGSAHAIESDVSDELSVRRMYERIDREFGAVDVLFNNAGVSGRSSIGDMSDREWEQVIETHVTGTYLCTKMALLGMCDRQRGSIVNMSSDYAAIGKADGAAYAAAKTAIRAFTRSIAAEFAAYGIRVNAVGPGPIDTALLRSGRDEAQWGRFVEARKSMIPIGRLGVPEDVARLVAYLCSERAQGLNGRMIHINGGRYMN